MSESKLLVYVSCGTDQEIRNYAMTRDTGVLTQLGTIRLPAAKDTAQVDGEPMSALRTIGAPLATSQDGSTLYASLRALPNRVASYRIDPATGALELLRVTPIPASTPFIGLDRSGHYLIGGAYYGNLFWVGKLGDDGSLAAQAFETSEGHVTPHSVLMHPNNRFLYGAATGVEEVLTFDFDEATGKLTRTGTPGANAIAGSTPRHMALHPSNLFLYVMNESSGTLDGFRIDPDSGLLTHVASADPRPPERQADHGIGADLHLSPDGNFLYGSSRALSAISVYAVDAETGGLAFVELVDAGNIPRSFAIDPSGRFLLAAGQGSNDITVFARDPATGRLTRQSSIATGAGPIWVEIVDPDSRG